MLGSSCLGSELQRDGLVAPSFPYGYLGEASALELAVQLEDFNTFLTCPN